MRGETGPAFMPRAPTAALTRERLLHDLDAHAGSPVIVLRAPAGGGKTTLLVDWLARSPRPGAWVTVDVADGRRLAFWQRVVSTLVRSGALPTDSILRTVTVSDDIADSLRATLLDGLSGLSPRLLLVLDDFQNVRDPQIVDDLGWLLAAGASLDVVVASRTPTAFEQPHERARLDTLVLGPADLAFDADEMIALTRAAGRPDSDGAAIREAFRGLPLAARATLLELASHPDWPVTRAVESVQHHGVRLLLAGDDLTGYQEFVLRLSVAGAADSRLIAELAGPDSAAHLARAEHDAVGTWVEDRDRYDGRTFVLQPYLREGLLAEFSRRLPHEAARVRSTYGRVLLARGDAIGAVRQFVEAGDWDAVTHAVLVGYSDLALLHAVELAELLASAGSAVLRRHPLLLVFLVMTANSRRALPRTTLLHKAHLAVALVQARLGGGDPGDRASLLVALLAVQRLGGQYDAALDTAERLTALLAASEDQGRESLLGLLPTAFVHAATTYFYAEQADRADELYRVAVDEALGADRPWPELHASSMRLLVQAMRGRPDAAALAAARERTRPFGWRGTYPAAGYHLAEAYEALEAFDGESARAQLDELAAHEHTIEHWPLIARLRGLAALTEGRPYLGLEQLTADLAAHADRPPTSRAMSTLLTVTRADLLLAEGEPHRAESVLRSVRREPAAALARGRAGLALGRHERVIADVADIAWAEATLPRPKAEALLLTAAAAVRLGRETDARLAAARALDLLAESGLRRPLMMVPRAELGAALNLTSQDVASLLEGVPDVFSTGTPAATLTYSEQRVLEELRRSGSTEDIASALLVSINTVKTHQRTIYRKLGVRTREAALAVATLRGMLGRDPD